MAATPPEDRRASTRHGSCVRFSPGASAGDDAVGHAVAVDVELVRGGDLRPAGAGYVDRGRGRGVRCLRRRRGRRVLARARHQERHARPARRRLPPPARRAAAGCRARRRGRCDVPEVLGLDAVGVRGQRRDEAVFDGAHRPSSGWGRIFSSASSARLAVDFTAPREMSRAAAISASLMPGPVAQHQDLALARRELLERGQDLAVLLAQHGPGVGTVRLDLARRRVGRARYAGGAAPIGSR